MAPGILNEYTTITIKGSVNFKRYGLKPRSAMRNPSIVIGGWALTTLSGENATNSFANVLFLQQTSALRLSNPSDAVTTVHGPEILPI
jgi:hypothetical protein